MGLGNIYGTPDLKQVFKNTWQIFKRVLPSIIIPYLILNIIQANFNKQIYLELITFVMAIILQNYLILTADAIIRAKNISVTKRLTIALKKTFPVILLILATGLMIGIGMLLFLIPGLYLIIKLILAWPVLLLENKDVVDSIKQSYTMTENNWWFISVATVILQFAVLIPFIIGLLVGIFTMYYTGSNILLPTLVGIIAAPMQIVAICNLLVVYYVIQQRQ